MQADVPIAGVNVSVASSTPLSLKHTETPQYRRIQLVPVELQIKVAADELRLFNMVHGKRCYVNANANSEQIV